MDEICGSKGEGVMIKDPKSKYERKRSYVLLKVKRFEDAEATVIGH
jgi:DNA ligase-1